MGAHTKLDGQPLTELDGDWLDNVTSAISNVMEYSRDNGDSAEWSGLAELWFAGFARKDAH